MSKNAEHIGHQPWGKTINFSSMRKLALSRGITRVAMVATVKLHGTNAAVRIEADGSVHFQSRNRDITPEDDNHGFAAWASTQDWRERLSFKQGRDSVVTIYGEWVGRGIMQGAACCSIPGRMFVEFADVDAAGLCSIYGDSPDTVTVYKRFRRLDLTDDIACQEFVNLADTLTAEVEAECPWTKMHYGISGVGEGLVWHVTSLPDYKPQRDLWFKTKGVKHSEVKRTKKPGISPETFESCKSFADAHCTDVRLTKLADALGPFSKKNTGDFVKSVASDILSETEDERSASGLPDKQVSKMIGALAANWYLARC